MRSVAVLKISPTIGNLFSAIPDPAFLAHEKDIALRADSPESRLRCRDKG